MNRYLEKLFASSRVSPGEILACKNDVYTFIYTKGGLDYLHARMVGDGIRYLWKAFRMSPGACMKYAGALLIRYVKKNE